MRKALISVLATALAAGAPAGSSPLAAQTRAAAQPGSGIYADGILPDGSPLEGLQSAVGVKLRGAEGACVNCHQRSGLGAHEGSVWLPPVTGDYLFRARVPPRGHEQEVAAIGGPHGARSAYTEATLARAIRDGVDADGHPLGDLMPRYALDDAAMAALIDYLRRLSLRHTPGLEGGIVHFATVLAPDVNPVKRRAVLDVLEHFVTERNASPNRPGLLLGTRAAARGGPGLSNRHWKLSTWSLSGPREGWNAQLEHSFAAEPVFAVLSGVGAAEWRPVHEFCERHRVPCFFPSVDVPVVADADFYSVYFSQGVLLEARLIADSIAAAGRGREAMLVHQIYRRGDSGAPAALALAAALARTGSASRVRIRDDIIPATADTGALRQALARVPGSAILVLWLRPVDVEALKGSVPPAASVWMSGLMSDGEQASLPDAWRRATRMTYPFELPQRRGVQLDYQLGWFRFRHIPMLAPQAQADAFLACTLMTDALKLMGEEVSSPYLIEQLHALLEHRTLTGYYPHLALARDQHFASKGAYVVHFAAPQGTALAPDTAWTVPP